MVITLLQHLKGKQLWLLISDVHACFPHCSYHRRLTCGAGLVPAEIAPFAIWLKKTSAIWLRPELWTQTNNILFIELPKEKALNPLSCSSTISVTDEV